MYHPHSLLRTTSKEKVVMCRWMFEVELLFPVTLKAIIRQIDL